MAVDDRYADAQPEPGRAGPAGRGAGTDLTPLPLADVWAAGEAVLDSVEQVVVGKRHPLTLVLAGVLAGGHVLLEDYPGLGKTLAARSLAQTLGLDFRRLQFTPDLLPSDVTGSFVYDQRSAEFSFRAGPLFCGLLLADEINRTPPKTQSALLEAMQERQVTVEGATFALPEPFHVIATANPIEYEGTYPLPEAQLDRFLLRIGFGYPERDEELDVLRRRMARQREATVLEPVLDATGLLRAQRTVEQVEVEDTVAGYCVDLAAATRTRPQVLVGASPRGALALLLVARALAVLRRRDYVTPEDVKAVALAVLGSPADAEAGDVAAPGVAAGRGPGDARRGARRRRPRSVRRFRRAECRASDRRPRAPGPPAWRPTAALARAVVLGAVLLLLAVLLRRADLVVLAAPLVLGAGLGLAARPIAGRRPAAGARRRAAARAAGPRSSRPSTRRTGSTSPRCAVALPPGPGPLTGAAAVSSSPGDDRGSTVAGHPLGPAPGRPGHAAGPPAGTGLLSWPAVRTDAVDGDDLAAAGGLRRRRHRAAGRGAGRRAPVPPAGRGRRRWPGCGRSSPATGCAGSTGGSPARTGELHVTATYSDRDAEVLLVLDSGQDLGRAPESSLDVGVRAAAAIAEHYLRAGDRVGAGRPRPAAAAGAGPATAATTWSGCSTC